MSLFNLVYFPILLLLPSTDPNSNPIWILLPQMLSKQELSLQNPKNPWLPIGPPVLLLLFPVPEHVLRVVLLYSEADSFCALVLFVLHLTELLYSIPQRLSAPVCFPL